MNTICRARPETISVAEICALTGLHRTTVYAMCDRYIARAAARIAAGDGPIPLADVRADEIVCSRWNRSYKIPRAFIEAKLAGAAGMAPCGDDD